MAKKLREARDAQDGSAHVHRSKKVKLETPPTSNGEDSAEATARAERKYAKKLAKLARKEVESLKTQSEAPSTNTSNDEAAPDPAAARKVRKAEKKRLKLLRRAAEAEEASTEASTGVGSETTKKIKANGTNGDFKTASSEPAAEHGTYTESPALAAASQSQVDTFLQAQMITIDDPTSPNPLSPIMSFDQLPRDAHTSLKQSFGQFESPTPIQSASWPFALSGRDVIGVAETGSGKTLAFGLPCLRHVLAADKTTSRGGAARAVIVSPTRELAVQIHEQLAQLAEPAGIRSVCVYGGVPKEEQRAALKKARIVVATPGRLNDLVAEGAAVLGGVTYLVLDEADRMLDKGFEDAIRQIVAATGTGRPATATATARQTLMFTATWPPSVRELAGSFMRQPVRVTIGDSPDGELRANVRITQRVEVVDPRAKERRLLELLREQTAGGSAGSAPPRILVFCLYKKEAARVESMLRGRGVHVVGLHGDMNQDRRTASLAGFRSGAAPVLVATDVAARGLDIPAVKAVINVTFPLTTEDYVHRIGRTGRAGAAGLAITLFTEHDKAQAGALINVLRAANQEVPEELLRFGTTVKRKQHEVYGAFYRDTGTAKKATKITFDD